MIISHPEAPFEVCKNSDFVGSTEFILNTIKEAKPNTKWLVGTELNLVNRLAKEMRPEGKLLSANVRPWQELILNIWHGHWKILLMTSQ